MGCAALAISTSRASSRGRKAAIAAGCMVGMSFMLCTAASMRPASNACSISLDEQALATRFSQRPAWDCVAGRPDGCDLDRARLGEGELAAARAEAEEGSGHDGSLP
jgi:hypothetical protein